jgi:hypothetical protein
VVEVAAGLYESLEKIPKNRRDIPTSVLDSLSKGILNTEVDASKIASLSNTYWLPQVSIKIAEKYVWLHIHKISCLHFITLVFESAI